MTQLVAPAERRFGVEIECYGGWDSQLVSGWDCKEDGSLGYHGSEIVSPKLRTAAGFNSLKRQLDYLNDAGAYVNGDCGLHVHHEVKDLTPRQIIACARSWFANQDAIHMMVNDDRVDNSWCYPLSQNHMQNLDRLEDQLEAGLTAVNDWYLCGHGAFSLDSISYYGTIEVRLHHATLDYNEIEGWVWFVRHFIDRAARSVEPLPGMSAEQLLYRTRTPKEQREYLKAKVARKREALARNQYGFTFNTYQHNDEDYDDDYYCSYCESSRCYC